MALPAPPLLALAGALPLPLALAVGEALLLPRAAAAGRGQRAQRCPRRCCWRWAASALPPPASDCAGAL